MAINPKKVAITGMGAICGLGNNLNDIWSNLIEGKSGVSNIEVNAIDDLAVKFAGEVKNFSLSNDLLPEKEWNRYDRFIHFALAASDEALKDSKILETDIDRNDISCLFGVGMGGFTTIEENFKLYESKGPRRVSPFFIPAIIPNMASGLVSIRFGLKGMNYTLASACASASHAISAAAQEIMLGHSKAVVTGGAESVVTNLPMSGFINMKALSKRNDSPQEASRPFCVGRDGFVMGEGAGILVLEDYEHAQKRGAKIYAELVSFGATSDAHHITAPHPEGEGAVRCMSEAIKRAGIKPNDIDYINAHGTSTPLGDVAETKALKNVFGDHAYKLKISSTKSMTGHLLGAAGGVETVFTAMTLHSGVIPPTINLTEPDPDCDLDYVPNIAQKKTLKYGLNNSFGFGGTNSSIILRNPNI
ncbi:MAG: beta-ketoacyl-ACP synthase II [Halobacteriovoraceae bacterium]|nr:beta-ketoacyl-ACP synthase II [Halobacteriovoraceae bacterium]